MGREAVTRAEWQGEVAEVKALLERTEIILRGDIKARLLLAGMTSVKVDGDDLILTHSSGLLRLGLGAAEAAKWLAKLTSPQPTLADRLGLKNGMTARAFGPWQADADLAEALSGRISDDGGLLVAVVLTPDDFEQAVDLAQGLGLPTWFVHEKGKSAVTDAMIRTRMRAEGWIDTKTSAVSDRLTTTRYNPRPHASGE